MINQRANLRVLAANGQLYSSTSLARSTSINSSSLSNRPVFFSSSSSNFVSPSHLSLKKIKPEPWQRLFEGKKQPSIKISPNNEQFSDVLNDPSVFDEISQTSFVPSPIQTHIDRLYEQVDELMVQLTEERFRHQQTRTKTEGEISKRLKEQERKFQELSHQTFRKHVDQLNEQERRLTELFNEKQKQDLQREKQLKEELAFVKNSFHLYKLSLHGDNTEQMNRSSTKDDSEETDRNQRHRTQIDNLRKHYENEISKLQKTLAEKLIDVERVESMKKELQFNRSELKESRDQAMNFSTRLHELENQHLKSIRELNDYRTRFDEQNKKLEKIRLERNE